MNTLASDFLPYNEDDKPLVEEEQKAAEKTTGPGGEQEVQWKVATKTAGITPATIVAGRLQANGIPARAWQEGAGQAYGLTVGLLGNGYVMVPETYLEQAKALLAEEIEEEE
jgi:adenine/guanine phosphoribosyltransferase-like PRPP-binding protein